MVGVIPASSSKASAWRDLLQRGLWKIVTSRMMLPPFMIIRRKSAIDKRALSSFQFDSTAKPVHNIAI